MLRRLGIRGKVLAALAVPVLVLFGAASVISSQAVQSSQSARAVSELVGTADELGALTGAMQVERQETLAFLANPSAPRNALDAARADTDTKSAEYAVAIAPIDVSALDPSVGEYLKLSRKSRESLPTLPVRWDVTGSSLPSVVDAQYTAIIKLHVETARVVANALSDRTLAKFLNAYGLVGEAREKLVHELPAAVDVVASRGADASAVVDLAPTIAVTTALRAQARTAVNQLRLTDLQLTSQDAAYAGQRLLLASGSASAVATMDLASFQKYSAAELAELSSLGDQVRLISVSKASDTAAATSREAAITIAATVLIVLVSIFIALLVARQIVVPLRRLTKAVGDVREALPRLVEQVSVPGETPQLSLVQIPVTSRDEVGRLARAFNDVNATTVQIAQEQAALRGSIAEMFVNVARRDQVLLNRQISFIDALEQTEEDPNVLGNLFRLDHLATRMRRNAESLLVLAGIESGRRMRDGMPLSDVIRTASSEIEQYDRVQLELGSDPRMVGFSALAAAHLLAELLENATVFSEPGTPVEVATSTDGEYFQVVVRDQGLGMSDAELEAAHAKIRSTAAGDVLGAQRLGFYVVGRLAARLNARVSLAKSPSGLGTVVVVRFPSRLFELSGAPVVDSEAPSSEPMTVPSLVEDEPPVVERVDLDALTDGTTSLGLPRRRARDDSGVLAEADAASRLAPAGAAAASDTAVPGLEDDLVEEPVESDPERDGRMFVLPPLEKARLAPELSVPGGGGWAPEVSASDSPSRLPNRANAARTVVGVDLGVATGPFTSRLPKADRGALFGGFRGRAADVPPSVERPPLDLRTIPGAHDVSESATAFVVPDLADLDLDDVFVIPELEPDEEPWQPDAYLGEALASESRENVAAPFVAPVVASPPVAATFGSAAGPVGAAPVGGAAVAEPGVPARPAFESSLNEARAWGTEDLSTSSWQPGSTVGLPVAPIVAPWAEPEPEPVVVRVATPQPVLVPVPLVPAQPTKAAMPPVPAPAAPSILVADAVLPEPVPEPEAAFDPQDLAPIVAPAAGAAPARPAKRGWFGRRSAAPELVPAELVPADLVPADVEPADVEPVSVEPAPVLPVVELPVVELPVVELVDEIALATLAPVEVAPEPVVAKPVVPEAMEAEPVEAESVLAEPVVAAPYVPEPYVPLAVAVPEAQPEPDEITAEIAAVASAEFSTDWPTRIGRHGRRGLPERRPELPEISAFEMAAEVERLEPPTPAVALQEPVPTAPVAPEPFVDAVIEPEPVVLPAAELAVEPEPAAEPDLVVMPEPETDLAPEPEPDLVVMPEPETDLAPEPEPMRVPWAPTSVAHIIGEALDPTPAPAAPVASRPAPEPHAKRGWWGRKPAAPVEEAPWFASATELLSPDSHQAAASGPVPIPWVSTSGNSTTGSVPVVVAEAAVPAPVPPVVVEIASVPLAPAQAVPAAAADVPIEVVVAPVVAPVAEVVADVVPDEPAAVAPAKPLPAAALPAVVLPRVVEVHAASMADTAKPARRGHRTWLGHKVPAADAPTTTAPTRSSAWDVPNTAPADAPAPTGDGRRTSAVPAPRWTPQHNLPESAFTPGSFLAGAYAPAVPSQGWAPPVPSDPPEPATPAGTPDVDRAEIPSQSPPPVVPRQPLSFGALDADVAAMLALRSDIQEQAFAELGQLAAYRPSVVGASASNSLKRRVPTAVPAQVAQPDSGRPSTRDADQLRSRLSSFQSGTSRGRIAAEQSVERVPGDADEPAGPGNVITRSRAAGATGTSHEEEE